MDAHGRVRVSYKGKVFEVKNFLEFTQKTRDLFEKEVDTATKFAVLTSLFETTLGPWQEMEFKTLDPYGKMMIARAWYNTSVGANQGEEPNIVY